VVNLIDPRTPIYNDLRMSMSSSVFDWTPSLLAMPKECPICRKVQAGGISVEQHADPICSDCWMCARHEQPEAWHCASCGKFLSGLDRYQLITRCDNTGIEYDFLCQVHYAERECLPQLAVS
jgi:hypothetical protein